MGHNARLNLSVQSDEQCLFDLQDWSMREYATARALRFSSMSRRLTCDMYHALRLRSWKIEHWPHSGVKAPRLGRSTWGEEART